MPATRMRLPIWVALKSSGSTSSGEKKKRCPRMPSSPRSRPGSSSSVTAYVDPVFVVLLYALDKGDLSLLERGVHDVPSGAGPEQDATPLFESRRPSPCHTLELRPDPRAVERSLPPYSLTILNSRTAPCRFISSFGREGLATIQDLPSPRVWRRASLLSLRP